MHLCRLFRVGLKLRRKSEGLAYENAENQYTRRTICQKIPGARTPKLKGLTEALPLRCHVNYQVGIINTSRVVIVIVEPCKYGQPRCPHCDGQSNKECDQVAVIKDCHNEDVCMSIRILN